MKTVKWQKYMTELKKDQTAQNQKNQTKTQTPHTLEVLFRKYVMHTLADGDGYTAFYKFSSK